MDDEEREYAHWMGAFHGAFEILNKEERIAVLFVMFAAVLLSLAVGYVYGDLTATDVIEKTETQLPNGTVEKAIEASKNRDTVYAFCETEGFEAGYPSANTDGGYTIQCYADRNSESISEVFDTFQEFAEYVEGQR